VSDISDGLETGGLWVWQSGNSRPTRSLLPSCSWWSRLLPNLRQTSRTARPLQDI